MSTHILNIIPTSPAYVPTVAAQQHALALLASFVPLTQEVDIVVTDDIQFVDQGENFERILCPGCQTAWCEHAKNNCDWWQEAMNNAYATQFTDLIVTMPCCGTTTSLNDLLYDMSAGFAKFQLVAHDPNIRGLDTSMIAALEHAISHPVRVIWARY